MSKTLVVYDSTGFIYSQMTGSYMAPVDLQHIEVDTNLYTGKIIIGVNAETKELILEDIPKTELQLAQESIETIQNYILDKEINTLSL